MKILLIDSHKGTADAAQNLHWLNADNLRCHLLAGGHEVHLIWSYPSVNENVHGGYDCIVFNHASQYSYISEEWLQKNDTAKLFYITNEYNLGEPVLLWSWVKQNDKTFDVIANHPAKASKVVKKFVGNWHEVNLNSLVARPLRDTAPSTFFDTTPTGCLYYGSFRKDRVPYFKKYFDGSIAISTHKKNRHKFIKEGITGPFCDRIDWGGVGLANYKASLYIEDVKTHTHYNHLANRFYEALNYNVLPIFDITCKNTVVTSGYDIPDWLFVDGPQELQRLLHNLPDNVDTVLTHWRNQALEERSLTLNSIANIIYGKTV
jgi:hypothetical protein